MRLTLLLLVLWSAQIISASERFYFVTHNLYMTYSLDVPVISSNRVKGDMATVTQQCRRTCAQSLSCKAYQVALLPGTNQQGPFNCSFYAFNGCDYKNTTLKIIPGTPFHRVWEKLDLNLLKPKACINYCAVKYKGDCGRCGALSNFTGLDCDIAPKLCSDYAATPDDLTFLPIWPWGFGDRNLTALCKNRETVIFWSSYSPAASTRNAFNLGWLSILAATTLSMYSTYMTGIPDIDWPLISELQSLSTEKKLFVHINLDTALIQNHAFSGLEIAPTGELSLQASLTGSTGFPTPLSRAPFILNSTGYGPNCGSFWQFSAVTSVCDQRTRLLNYGSLTWDGQTSVGLGEFSLSFK